MNKIELFEAIGEIDSDLIIRRENEVFHTPKQIRVRWVSVAACLCLVILCIFILPIFKQIPSSPITPESNSSQPTTSDNALLYINQLAQEPSFQNSNISLNLNDFIAMTDDQLQKYYGVSFSISKAVPALERQPQNPANNNGIFKNSSRGTYYDSHTFVFANDGNTQRIEIMLSKTAYYPGLIVSTDENGTQLKQSEINGFAVTIFRYVGEDGSDCLYTEFLNNGIAYCITSYNLSQKDYAAALSLVIADNVHSEANPSGAEDTHMVHGTVNAVDQNANLISISAGDSALSALKIYLPDGEAKNYFVGDQVEVSYVGNPITICTIWAQQIKSIDAADKAIKEEQFDTLMDFHTEDTVRGYSVSNLVWK